MWRRLPTQPSSSGGNGRLEPIVRNTYVRCICTAAATATITYPRRRQLPFQQYAQQHSRHLYLDQPAINLQLNPPNQRINTENAASPSEYELFLQNEYSQAPTSEPSSSPPLIPQLNSSVEYLSTTSFWPLANCFLMRGELTRARTKNTDTGTTDDASAGQLEARWSAECLSVIQAEIHPTPTLRPLPAQLPTTSSSGTIAPAHIFRPSDSHLVQLSEWYRVAKEQSAELFTLEKFTQATQAIVRLTMENPKRPKALSRRGKRELHPSRTDPLFAIRILADYWAELNHPSSPRSLGRPLSPSQLCWWKMQTTMQAVLGLVARTRIDGADDRPQLLQMILERMRHEKVPDGAIAGVRNLYDYAMRHDAFFRAVLFTSLHCNNLTFASSLLPLIPKLCFPMPLPSGVIEWRPIPRFNQVNLFHLFMAKCCSEIFHRFQIQQLHETPSVSDDDAALPSASTSTTSVSSSPLQYSSFSRTSLVNLYPSFADLHSHSLQSQSIAPTFDRALSLRFTSPLSQQGVGFSMTGKSFSSKLNSHLDGEIIEARSSMLDILLNGFKIMVESGLSPNMNSYNFILFGLTHTVARKDDDLRLANSLPTISEVRALLTECLSTISTERTCFFNMSSYMILLTHTLRLQYLYDGTANDFSLMQWTLRALKDTLKQFKKTMWKLRDSNNDEGDPVILNAMLSSLILQATVVLTKASTDTNKVGKAILHIHDTILPLLPTDEEFRHIQSQAPAKLPPVMDTTIPSIASTAGPERPRSPSSSWSKLVFIALCQRGCISACAEYLERNFSYLTDTDLMEGLQACPSAAQRMSFYLMMEEWMTRLSVTNEPHFKPDPALIIGAANGPDVRNMLLSDSNAPSTQPSSATSLALPGTSSSPLTVNDIFLKWQLAKSRLSPTIRFELGLGVPTAPAALEAIFHPKDGPVRHDEIASVHEAARYVIYHARKLHLEHTQVDSPFLPSIYQTPDFKLPASIVRAPNFVTGWVVLCAGWFTHLSEDVAFNRILDTLYLVSKAAEGQNDWNMDTTTNSTAILPTENEQDVPPKPSVFRKFANWFKNWASQEKEKLLDNPIQSIHLFSPPPSSSPLLEQPIAFHQLRPELLGSIIYAFGTQPHLYDPKSTHWLKVLKRIEPLTDLFDVSQQNPIMVKYFTLQCNSESLFLELFSSIPITALPNHCAALAGAWDPTRSVNDWVRGRRLLLYILRMSMSKADRLASPVGPQQSWLSEHESDQVLSIDLLKQCLRPFIKKISSRGLVGELRWWLTEISRLYPRLYSTFWESIHRSITDCVSLNEAAVLKFLKSKPPLTKSEIEARGHLMIQEAKDWRWSMLEPEALANPTNPKWKNRVTNSNV